MMMRLHTADLKNRIVTAIENRWSLDPGSAKM